MKRLKSIVNKLFLTVFGFTFISLIVLLLISTNVKTDILHKSIPKETEISDSVIVHFIHGSIPQENCEYDKVRLGKYLGGHVEIEIDEFVFGFLNDSIPINFLPKETYNSKFEIHAKKEWSNLTKNDKITSIHIPITLIQKNNLISSTTQYLKVQPYDYAFLGHRCTSSAAEILSDSGILNEFSNLESIIAFYYPRALRFTLLKFAKKNQLKIDFQSGIYCHNWE